MLAAFQLLHRFYKINYTTDAQMLAGGVCAGVCRSGSGFIPDGGGGDLEHNCKIKALPLEEGRSS